MKKKFITLLMAFVMVFNFAAVSMAAESELLERPTGIDIMPATGADAVAAATDEDENTVVFDLRAAEDYAKCHMKGTVSTPVCLPASADYEVNTTLKAAFVDYVKANIDADDKIYLVCYMGTFCVDYAGDWLMNDCGIEAERLYRVAEEAGMWNDPDLVAAYQYADADYALKAQAAGNIILDVRATEAFFGNGYVDGSLHQPLFKVDAEGNTSVTTGDDDLATAFLAFVEANKDLLSSKEIYIVCNSGARGAQNATTLLAKAGMETGGMNKKVFTIEGGAKGAIANSFVKAQNVEGKDAVAAIGSETVAIIDVRATEKFAAGHLKGSLSMPLFNANGVTTGSDALAKDFLASVAANKAALEGKDLYIVCNSGARGAQAATKLLMQAGYSNSVIYTITGGAKGTDTDKSVPENLTYVTAAQALSVVGNDAYVIIDVRAAQKYEAGHLKGSVSMPLFKIDENGNQSVTDGNDDLAKAFNEALKANEKAFEGKTLYILCNSGARGAEAASKLLLDAGYARSSFFTIEGGAKNQSIIDAFVTADDEKPEVKPEVKPETKPEVKPETKPEAKPDNDKSDVPKTGDASVAGIYLLAMAAAVLVIIARKRIAK